MRRFSSRTFHRKRCQPEKWEGNLHVCVSPSLARCWFWAVWKQRLKAVVLAHASHARMTIFRSEDRLWDDDNLKWKCTTKLIAQISAKFRKIHPKLLEAPKITIIMVQRIFRRGMYTPGWRHALRSGWPFISIIYAPPVCLTTSTPSPHLWDYRMVRF